jgi:phosphatidylglycerophosphatase C
VSPQSDGTDPADRPGVAAFDFDGTLSVRDTLVPFLVGLAGRRAMASLLGGSGAELVRGRGRSRDAAKTIVLRRVMTGRPAVDVAAAGTRYAARLLPGLRPDGLERVRWHQQRGDRVVLVSASLGVYLRPLADELGLDGVEAVELVVDADGLLTGAMTGPNCRGPEKVVRLDGWLAGAGLDRSSIELWAYGDSTGDDELLAAADHAHRCARPPRKSGDRRGVRITG